MAVMQTKASIGKNLMRVGMVLGASVAALQGCSSSPDPSERAVSSESEALFWICPPGETLDCNYDYVCLPGGGCHAVRTCDCVCDQVMCGTACVDTSTDPQNCGGCGIACTDGTTCVAGACSYSACVYTPPPTCTSPPPPDKSPTCKSGQEGCTNVAVGGSFATCPLPDGSCPNFNTFETALQALGCQPGGDPFTNTRTVVCYNPPSYPPGVIRGYNSDRQPIFNCGYGNDWHYAVCRPSQALTNLVGDFDHNTTCEPVAPVGVSCASDTGLTDVIVYYDPSCAGSCQ
jgi:hypothetical protein